MRTNINVKTYISFFRIRFINGLQYRAAAWAGVSTQFAWGFMTLLMFNAFYQSNPGNFPMEFEQLASYIWLQQATLALFAAWGFEMPILDSISSGDVSYELCRPVGLYWMWFVRTVAARVASVSLRCAPVLVIAALLPRPYGISLPASPVAFLQFFLSLFLGLLIMVSLHMLIYISTFYTMSSTGVRNLFSACVEILAGGIIPLQFLPEGVRKVFMLLPFASMQNTAFNVYNGLFSGAEANFYILLQVVWIVLLVAIGGLLLRNTMKKVVVQGG